MINDDFYIISDFEGFINSTRALVFNNFGKPSDNDDLDEVLLTVLPEEQEELDRVLSHNEASLIAKELLRKQTNRKTKEVRYLVSDSEYRSVIDAFHHRMVGNLLHGLVNKGLVESSYDEEVNDFVFWIKDDNTQEDQDTETN